MLGFDRIDGFSAQDDLFLAARHADAAASCIGADPLRNRLCVGDNDDIENPDQFLIGAKDRDIGCAGLFSLEVKHAIGYRQDIRDVGRADNRRAEGRAQSEGPRLETSDLKPANRCFVDSVDAL